METYLVTWSADEMNPYDHEATFFDISEAREFADALEEEGYHVERFLL